MIEVSRTLVKSPPELWTELEGNCLAGVIGEAEVRVTKPDRALAWEAADSRGTAVLEPSGWGTKLTLTAEIEERVAVYGFWARVRREPRPVPDPRPRELEQRLTKLLDELGSAHRKKPFSR